MSAAAALAGRTAIVTGATSGIGEATALGLATCGARVLLVGRDRERGAAVLAKLEAAAPQAGAAFVPGDFASLADVRRLAGELLAAAPRLDVLVNNAGVVMLRRTTTADGFETTYAVNHLAPFLLTGLLLPRLRESGAARIVNVASEAHRFGALDLDDLQSERSFASMRVYGRSKTANILFTRELARRLGPQAGVTANCLHPGAIASRLGRGNGRFWDGLQRLVGLFMKTPEQGARTSLHLATSPAVAGVSGRYFVDCRERDAAAHACDAGLAAGLWERSEAQSGLRWP